MSDELRLKVGDLVRIVGEFPDGYHAEGLVVNAPTVLHNGKRGVITDISERRRTITYYVMLAGDSKRPVADGGRAFVASELEPLDAISRLAELA